MTVPSTQRRLGNGLILSTATWSAAQVACQWPHIIQPPSRYFECQNKGGVSKFPPGMPPAFYDPFIAYFEERAQTAAAQVRLYKRKYKGELAAKWMEYERGWRAAARVALMRKQRELLRVTPIAEIEIERPAFEWDEEAAS